jgi:hypothetical protein
MHDAPDFFAVATSHIVIIRRPPLAPATFASFDENKLNLANPPLEYSPARSTKAQKLSVMLDHGRIELKVPLGNILNRMFHRNAFKVPMLVSRHSPRAEARMKREDEYRQLASDILQRASEEQSAILRAQWEILSASYMELAGQSKRVEENDAQYDPIPWDRLRRH